LREGNAFLGVFAGFTYFAAIRAQPIGDVKAYRFVVRLVGALLSAGFFYLPGCAPVVVADLFIAFKC
jgi:hypothetical protein